MLGVAAGMAAMAVSLAMFGVGAAVGAAFMPSRETLEGIAKSVETFGSIDSTNLSAVGKGMTDIGIGLAVFGVGGKLADLLKVEDGDTSENKESKLILNGYKRDNYQRQMAQKVLNDIDPEDWIIINDIDEIPNLIYDHNEILTYSLHHLRNRVRNAPIGFNLLPEKFTLLHLMQLYQEILGVELDKPNFRRKILKMKLLVDLKEKQQDVSHRAAKLYKFDPEIYNKLTEKGFNFEM